jgi:hypothetical protein
MRTRRIVAAMLLVTQVAGCTRMRSLEAPGPYVESRRPGSLWVRLANGPEMKLESPRVIADTVFGFNAAGAAVTLPLAELENVRVREMWVGPTIAIGVLTVGILAGVAALIAGGGDDRDFQGEDPLD